MEQNKKNYCVGIVGAGTMGSGIAQLAASYGCKVFLFDALEGAASKAFQKIEQSVEALVAKGKITADNSTNTISNIKVVASLNDFSACDLVIEAIIEDLGVKKELFRQLESICTQSCILATNTSSISVTAVASACKLSGKVIGIHFFNPATIMPLVEIIPGLGTNTDVVKKATDIIKSWGKTTVLAKDTPGFIVNRVARSFYGESIRIYEEGIAGFAEIDWALKEFGGFKMGPFELMDFIGNDVNFKVTETVWQQMFLDGRYKPSITQKRLYEAGYFGRKSGRGYYDYSGQVAMQELNKNKELGSEIFIRVISMLINEAYDALYYKIASKEDLDMAMMKGVNYPKGLIQWSEEIGITRVLNKLQELHSIYLEERYRPSVLLRKTADR